MMSRFKLSNQIFDLGLTAKEMSVYAYLCSIVGEQTLTGEKIVKVKRSTIALNCCCKGTNTIAKIMIGLTDKGLVTVTGRSVKANHHKGTYIYAVKQLPTDKNYFFVDRYVFGKLNFRQMMIYLFMCKSYSPTFHDSWNSYNDIASQTGLERSMVIQTVKELTEMHFIVKCRRKSADNHHVFVDNHYQVVFYVRGKIKHKKMMRLHSHTSRTNSLLLSGNRQSKQVYFSTLFKDCQEGSHKNFCRGSPMFLSSRVVCFLSCLYQNPKHT